MNLETIKKVVQKSYDKAKSNLPIIEKRAILEMSAHIVSDNIPGYSSDKLDFGSYHKDNYAVLFIDMRDSSKRAKTIGAEKTFTSMHAFISGMLEVIKHHKGVVIDIMGDGFMVFFGGDKSELTKGQAVQNAGLCGRDMLVVIDKVINPILKSDGIWNISCGVGITYGDVIVTKVGINEVYDVKAFGECINTASKYADEVSSQVKVSKQVKDMWPSSKGGKISFRSCGEGYILS